MPLIKHCTFFLVDAFNMNKLNGVLLLTLAPSLAVFCQSGQVSFNFAWIPKMDHGICKELIKNSLY